MAIFAFNYKSSFPIKGKKVAIYTTAADISLRLTPTETVEFSDFGQPLETQPCIFVDPSKTFQTLVGIGAALTDASAETFAKLPKNKQQEFMQQYFKALVIPWQEQISTVAIFRVVVTRMSKIMIKS